MYLYKLPNVFVFAMQPVTQQGGPEFGQIFCYNLPASPNLVTILHLPPIQRRRILARAYQPLFCVFAAFSPYLVWGKCFGSNDSLQLAFSSSK